MRITDILYDEWQIDGVLEELIMSKPVQRLKGVHQGGASYLINEKWNVTRYEHSVGVMLLIRKLGGSLSFRTNDGPLHLKTFLRRELSSHEGPPFFQNHPLSLTG